MKKFAVAVVALVAFAAPVFAATNPFMDVPMNHWSYDAIGQLAAHGILSGYPDGTYKGKQPTTRYEMASALARALAVVDMTKASKQDVEMLKKLVVEFKDELEALGVRVDDLDERVKVIEDRLGGWHIHGQLRFDITNSDEDEPKPKSEVYNDRARLWFERRFGEDEEMFFRARLDNTRNGNQWQQFFVTMPFFWDSRLTVGRFLAYEEMTPYFLGGDTNYDFTTGGSFTGLDDIIGDRQITGLGWEKTFGMGSVKGYVAHPHRTNYDARGNAGYEGHGNQYTSSTRIMGGDYGAWEVMLMGNFQFTEQFGFDLGGHLLMHDNAEPVAPAAGDWALTNMWTIWAGLRFNFNENIAFKGIYYHQKRSWDTWLAAGGWQDEDDGNNHWRVILDVNQELLKFTGVWLEYGQMDQGFASMTGLDGQGSMFATSLPGGVGAGGAMATNSNVMFDDLKYWRVALHQQWNEKWSTHLFYYGYKFDLSDEKLTEWGLGVKYQYNPSVAFGLNYVNANWSELDDKDHILRFRTFITF
jgi:hypothetical protein